MTAPVEAPDRKDGFQVVERETNRKDACLADVDAERAVLGALLIAKGHGLGAELGLVLDAEMFTVPAHRALYAAIAQLRADQVAVDPVVLRSVLESHGQGAHAGVIGPLYDEVPTPDHAPAHAQLVRTAARRRELVTLSRQLAVAAQDPTIAVDDAVAKASSALVAHARPAGKGEGFVDFRFAAIEALRAMDDRKAGVQVRGVPTGIPEIDKALGGSPQKGTLVLVAGVPSCGKTSTVWQILQGIAIDGHGKAAFVSAEMKNAMLANWSYAQLASVPLTRIQDGEHDAADARRMVEVSKLLTSGKIFTDETNRPSISDIVMRCRLLKAQHPDLVAIGVDFLQLVQEPDARRSDLREQVLREVAYDLKAVALECDVVMYVLAQVNAKQVASREDKRPLESDIAGSSGPMEAADAALMVYREAIYETGAGNDMEIAVAKNKFGPRGGVAKVWWEGQFVRVASPKRRHDERQASGATA